MRHPEAIGMALRPLPPEIRRTYASVINHPELNQQSTKLQDRFKLFENVRVLVLAHYFQNLDIRWIFGIPDGALSLAKNMAHHLPNTQIIRTKKLEKKDLLFQWQNPLQFDVFSPSLHQLQTIIMEAPSFDDPILVVDLCVETGRTATDVLTNLQSHGFNVAALGVGLQHAPGTIEQIAHEFHIPVVAAVNKR